VWEAFQVLSLERRYESGQPLPITSQERWAYATGAGWSGADLREASPMLRSLDRVWMEAAREGESNEP